MSITFCFSLIVKGCLSIVPQSFIDSPLHCLECSIPFMFCRSMLIGHDMTNSSLRSGPVDSVCVDLRFA